MYIEYNCYCTLHLLKQCLLDICDQICSYCFNGVQLYMIIWATACFKPLKWHCWYYFCDYKWSSCTTLSPRTSSNEVVSLSVSCPVLRHAPQQTPDTYTGSRDSRYGYRQLVMKQDTPNMFHFDYFKLLDWKSTQYKGSND